MSTFVYQGVTATAKYVTVYFANRIGTADRVREVKIPIGDLATPEILDQVDRHLAKVLREHWQQGEQPLEFPDEPAPPWD